MPFVIGESIGQYRLVEQLGQGGMATVFKGYHARLERYVAIKALHPAFTEDENFLARFNREAKVVANLDHPNIVPIYDFSEHEGRPYLVMKYIKGETLKARLTASPMALEETLRIVEKAGEALSYAHVQGVLHRDIKPSNVLLTPDGQIYLADFGLARIAAAGESSLTADRMVGTPQYMSPEQAVAKSDLDQRSDIYSFGVMLYEMVVGQVPFNADTPFAIIHDHIYTPLPLPKTVNPDVSEAVQLVLLKALAKEPDDRFENMQDLMSALRKAIREDISPELAVGADGSTQLAAMPPIAGIDTVTVAAGAPVTEVLEAGEEEKGDRRGPKARKKKEPKEPGKMKKRWQATRKGWRIFWIVLSVLFLLFCCLSGLGGVLENWQDQAEQPALIQEDPELALQEAEVVLGDALSHWRKGDLEATFDAVYLMQDLAGDDDAFYQMAFERMAQEQAWLVAVMTVLDWPMEALEPMKQEARMVFYLAARDRLSGGIWEDYGDHPYAQVAKIRHELYYGDPQIARDKLNRILRDEDMLQDYPEAALLEAEIHAHLGEMEQARVIFRELIRNRKLPEWVRDALKNISMEYNLPVSVPEE
jgi:serine/threonine protein kinase